MGIGERIRFIRNLRGMTQKWLGIEAGFPKSSADIRIVQYETGARTPKAEILKEIAKVLDVSPRALNVPDIDTELGLMHTFFALEDIYGLKPVKTEEGLSLKFSNPRFLIPHLDDMISTWAEMAEKFSSGEIKKEEYDTWRYQYPDHTKLQGYVQGFMSKELSDMLIEELKKTEQEK